MFAALKKQQQSALFAQSQTCSESRIREEDKGLLGKRSLPEQMEGQVKTVTESEGFYHLLIKNSSSTKAGTPGSANSDSADPREFKLAKRDLYLERKQESPKCEYRDLLQAMNI